MNKKLRILSFGLSLSLLSFFTATASLAEPTPKIETIGGIELIHIKGGIYVMGDITGRDKTASPAHKVTVGDFYIGKYEVTFDQYDAFCEATKRAKPSDNGWGRSKRPAINVTWKEAMAFTEWLSTKFGKTYRLPSESEWEYAARAETASTYWWGNQTAVGLANCKGCFPGWTEKTLPVGSFPANPWGLYDMTGNVYEWVSDDYHKDYTNAPDDGSTWLKGDKKQRLSRGGSWYYDAEEVSSFKRCYDFDAPYNYQGFRVVMEP